MQRHHVRPRAVQVRLGKDLPFRPQVPFQERQQVRLARREGRRQSAEVRPGWNKCRHDLRMAGPPHKRKTGADGTKMKVMQMRGEKSLSDDKNLYTPASISHFRPAAVLVDKK